MLQLTTIEIRDVFYSMMLRGFRLMQNKILSLLGVCEYKLKTRQLKLLRFYIIVLRTRLYTFVSVLMKKL